MKLHLANTLTINMTWNVAHKYAA
uniref:Uncharacterized protein n=1 Tax=Anguilla anguilla TaxID=7936 RepID=A0A0E9XW36_ANGAN